MKTGKRNIKSGSQFDALFPSAKGEFETIKKVAGLQDTIKLMRHVIATTLSDTKELARQLRASTLEQTCLNIWQFCFDHLQYTKDEMGKEQVRRPARSWQDRKQGVDCDCMSVFIGSILTNLGIPWSIRLTKYQSPEFEHVYPVANATSECIIMDAVVYEFNREVPYSSKKDIKMELQYLNGFEGGDFDDLDKVTNYDLPYDAQGLILDEDLEGLDGRAERLARRESRQENRNTRPPIKSRIQQGFKKGIHAINRVNPSMVLLRTGILVSMKLNIMNVASKLRFAYWTDQQARAKNMDLNKFNELKRILEKIGKVFHGAGGKPINLKNAILSGRGNRDRQVTLNGLGEIISEITDFDDVRTILGEEVFTDEVPQDGINGLGAVATTAAVSSASGIMAMIAKIIKGLGGLFRKGSSQAEQEILQDNTAMSEEQTRRFSFQNLRKIIPNRLPASMNTRSTPIQVQSSTPTQEIDTSGSDLMERSDGSDLDDSNPQKGEGVMGWIKENPKLSIGIAATVVGGTILAIRVASKKKRKRSLNGVTKSRSKGVKKTTKGKSKKRKAAKKKRSSKAKKYKAVTYS